MKIISVLGILAMLAAPAIAQLSVPSPLAVSSSGQFVVLDLRNVRSGGSASGLATNTSLLELEPSFLVISCERIKQALNHALATDASWQGKIHLAIRPAQSDNDAVTIVSERYRSSWNYRVELPRFVERKRFVRGIVRVLLQERANRTAGDRAAEVPAWLIEGLAGQLSAARGDSLLLSPPHKNAAGMFATAMNMDNREHESVEAARRTLREHPPLTLEQLSWPTEAQLASELYVRSAQLFVTELQRLGNGNACLRAMISDLGRYYNWQTAFLGAFKMHFPGQLDLEKWWALQNVYFTGRDFGRFWTAEESITKLNSILQTSVSVRRAVDDLPTYTEVPLQAVIREWDTARQTEVLEQMLRELDLMRLRVSPEFMTLVNDYRRVLDNYLRERGRAAFTLPDPRSVRPSVRSVVREAVRQLDELDRKRAEFKPQSASEPGQLWAVNLTGRSSNL